MRGKKREFPILQKRCTICRISSHKLFKKGKFKIKDLEENMIKITYTLSSRKTINNHLAAFLLKQMNRNTNFRLIIPLLLNYTAKKYSDDFIINTF